MAGADSSPPAATAELASLVERTAGWQPWRRVIHVGNGLMLALAPGALGLERALITALLAAAAALLLAADFARLRAPRYNVLFFRAFPSLASPREAAGVASSTWYAIGACLAWGLFPAYAQPSLLVLALADPFASVVGRRWGRRRLGKGTTLGSLAFFAMAAVVLLLSTGEPLTLIVAALVALVEVFPWKVDDNLTVPLVVGVLLSLLVA